MACISPITIPIPGRDRGKGFVHVPCGYCIECLKDKRADWTFRLQQELKRCKSACFITMTYDDNNIPEGGSLVKRDVQLFLKRLRKDVVSWIYDINPDMKVCENVSKYSQMKYYLVGEYGSRTKRPHYHAIMFNVPPRFYEELTRYWNKGFVKVGSVETASIHYVTKYVINRHKDFKGQEPFALVSKNIGYDYIKDNAKWHKSGLKAYVVNESGKKQRLPRYYKDKVFNIKEKEVICNERIIEKDKKDMEIRNDLLRVGENPAEAEIRANEKRIRKFKNLNKKDII